MSFVNAKEMLLAAQKGGYAVPAFNAENLEMVQAIITAAEKENSPVIIQTTPAAVYYMTLPEAVAIVRAMALRTTIPVALHLDHCVNPYDIVAAMKEGYTSVMYDGSNLSYSQNAEQTRKLATLAHDYGVTIEAKLSTPNEKNDGAGAVEEARTFAAYTGIDFLAVAISNVGGSCEGECKPDFDLLSQIRSAVDAPLVLDSTCGISDEQIKKCISLGIAKVNVGTDLSAAATKAVRQALLDESIIDPKKYLAPAREAVESLCIEKIKVCGSSGKAQLNFSPFN